MHDAELRHNLLRRDSFVLHDLKLQNWITHATWMVSYYFALVEINQNSCCKFTDIFFNWEVDQEEKTRYDWSDGLWGEYGYHLKGNFFEITLNFIESDMKKNILVSR